MFILQVLKTIIESHLNTCTVIALFSREYFGIKQPVSKYMYVISVATLREFSRKLEAPFCGLQYVYRHRKRTYSVNSVKMESKPLLTFYKDAQFCSSL